MSNTSVAAKPLTLYRTPTVHLNGTGRDTLVDGYTEAWRAAAVAIEALERVEFHSRDYHVQGPGAYSVAAEQRQQKLIELNGVKHYIETILEALQP